MARARIVLRIGFGTLTLAGVALTVRNLAPSAASAQAVTVVPPPEPAVAASAAARPDSLARRTAARNPFRIGRTASTVPFRPEGDEEMDAPPPPPPAAPRPALVLAGVVLGEEPAALIDGLPGTHATQVLLVGAHFGDYLLRSLTADAAVIAGPDTVWTLRVRSRFP